MEHQIDWSATAAWIALAISIISPAITTILSNRHQLKLRELDIQEKHSDASVMIFLQTPGLMKNGI